MKKILVLVFTISIVNLSKAQWVQLQNPAISKFEENSMVFTGTSILIATDGGIFRSTDNGITWNMSNIGLDTASINVQDITYINNEVFVSNSGKLYKSTNDGQTWINIPFTGIPPGGWISKFAKVGNRLIIPYSYYSLIPMCILIYTDNNGVTWNIGDTLDMYTNYWWNILEDNNLALFMINEMTGDKLYYTIDGITTQEFPLTGIPMPANLWIDNFSITQSGLHFFYQNNEKCFRFNFSSGIWEEKMNGMNPIIPEEILVMLFEINSHDDITFTSALFMDLFTGDLICRYFRSIDYGDTWTETAIPGYNFIIIDNSVKSDGNRLIGRYFKGNIIYSDDLGLSWNTIHSIFSGEYGFMTDLENENIFVVSPGMDGILKSVDHGNSWTLANGNIPDFYGLYFLSSISSVGNTLFVADNNEMTGLISVYKSTNFGATWAPVLLPIDTLPVEFIGYYDSQPVIHFGDWDDIKYYYTPDVGATWTEISGLFLIPDIKRVYGFTGKGSTLFAFIETTTGERKVYKSINFGASFTDATNGVSSSDGVEILVGNMWVDELHTTAIANYCGAGSCVFLAGRNYNIPQNPICFYQYNFITNTWNLINPSGINLPQYNTTFYTLKQFKNVWFLVTSVGVYASADNFNTWVTIWNNEGYQQGMQPVSFITQDNAIYLGTNQAGIWKTTLLPIVSTVDPHNIITTSAISGGNIISKGGLPFIDKGVCWATHNQPTLNDNFISAGTSYDSYLVTITGLSSLVTYYARAYVISPFDTVYGDIKMFTTPNFDHPQIYPDTAIYYLTSPSDVSTTVFWNEASHITTITDNFANILIENVDYAVNTNSLVIYDSYLSNVLLGHNDQVILDIDFDIGNNATFTIIALDTTIFVESYHLQTPFIYPNPNNGIFYINTSDSWNANVFDLTGKKILMQNIQPGINIVNMHDFPQGIYLIQLLNNEEMHLFRIVLK